MILHASLESQRYDRPRQTQHAVSHHAPHKSDRRSRWMGIQEHEVGSTFTREREHSQIADDNVRGGWRIIGCHSYMSARFMAGLSQLPDRESIHWDVGTRDLNQRRSNRRHDECKEERVTFFSPGMNVGHERWFVQAWCQRVHEIEKECKDQQDSVPLNHVFQTMRSIIVRERRDC
jgi:hypothetical protein